MLGELAELRPEGEETLVLARRIFADGRTRAYAWGRSAAREDVAAAVEALLAMSGQFEQRRLARPAYQLAMLDAFAGTAETARAARRAWRELAAARRAHDELTRDAAAAEARLDELRALVAGHRGPRAGRGGRAARRAGAAAPRHRARARAPRPRSRRSPRTSARAGRTSSRRPSAPSRRSRRSRPSSPRPARRSAAAELALREVAIDLRRFLDSLEAEPGRLEQVEGRLEQIADLRRRYRADTYAELLERAAEARTELDALADGHDPARAAAEALAAAAGRGRPAPRRAARRRGARRRRASPRRSRPSSRGSGSARASSGSTCARSTRARRAPTRPSSRSGRTPGLPFGPVAETASGGELSRIALAIAAVGGGETMVFDEIDAGIGGQTAHAVGETLRRLAGRAQVITITHLPQIASLADRHFRVEKVPATRRTRGSSRSTPTSAARSSSACSAAPSSSPRCGSEPAPPASCSPHGTDVWGFLAEPYHLSDWWPGILGVEPDRRGFAPGARWRVIGRDRPAPVSARSGCRGSGARPGPPARQALVIDDDRASSSAGPSAFVSHRRGPLPSVARRGRSTVTLARARRRTAPRSRSPIATGSRGRASPARPSTGSTTSSRRPPRS